jgi:hypothetical protein
MPQNLTPLTDDEIRGMVDFSKPPHYVNTLYRSEPTQYLVSTGESKKYDIIVDYFVDIVTSKYDQDVSLLLVGNKGGGKSRTGLSLCYYAACELAERKGGEWEDYFDPIENMAIISPHRASEVMSIKRKYAVKNYDDIGIGWGARRWQKNENIEKGEVFQISRIDNQLQVFSVPNQFLLDKIPRSLVSHYAEMDQQFFDYGFTTIKLFKPTTLFREGKIIQPFLYSNRVKYVLYRIPKPPEFLDKLYTRLRKEATTEAMRQRLDNKNKVEKVHKSKPKAIDILSKYRLEVVKFREEGQSMHKVNVWLSHKTGIPVGTFQMWWQRLEFEKAGIS